MSSGKTPREEASGADINESSLYRKPASRSADRSSWIYNPIDQMSVPTTDEGSEVNAAIDLLSNVDLADVLRDLAQNKHLSGEEAMDQIQHGFCRARRTSGESSTSDKQHSRYKPSSVSTATEDSSAHTVRRTQTNPPEAYWTLPHDHPRGISPWSYPPRQTLQAQLHATTPNHHLPATPLMPTFPSLPMSSLTRPFRGATVRNAYTQDGYSLDQRPLLRKIIWNARLTEDNYHYHCREVNERSPYNPTASAFAPKLPQHASSRSMNSGRITHEPNTSIMNGLQSPTSTISPVIRQSMDVVQYSAFPYADADDHDDSGLGFTPPRDDNDSLKTCTPIPPQLNQGVTGHRRFVPMNAALNPTMFASPGSSLFRHPTAQPFPSTKFSERYLGQHTDSNASANIPEHFNCAIWMRNLPPDVTYQELLGSIHGVGRIWCSYINHPDFEKHHTAAAKVVFYCAESARAFLQFVWTRTPEIRHYPIRADLNRIRSSPHSLAEGTSRVLIVTGEDWFANEDYLIEWFGQQCQFQFDRTVLHVKLNGRAVIEFRFGSYRSQAEACYKALTINCPRGFHKVDFGDDPCEVGETYMSKAIALQMIQGIGIAEA